MDQNQCLQHAEALLISCSAEPHQFSGLVPPVQVRGSAQVDAAAAAQHGHGLGGAGGHGLAVQGALGLLFVVEDESGVAGAGVHGTSNERTIKCIFPPTRRASKTHYPLTDVIMVIRGLEQYIP